MWHSFALSFILDVELPNLGRRWYFSHNSFSLWFGTFLRWFPHPIWYTDYYSTHFVALAGGGLLRDYCGHNRADFISWILPLQKKKIFRLLNTIIFHYNSNQKNFLSVPMEVHIPSFFRCRGGKIWLLEGLSNDDYGMISINVWTNYVSSSSDVS